MGRSNALRLTNVRTVFQLLGDCRDAGRTLGGWYPVALAGLNRLSGSLVTTGGLIRWGAEPVELFQNAWDVGWPTRRDRETWKEIMTGPRLAYQVTPVRVLQVRSSHVFRSRPQLVPDREWLRSVERDDRRSLGQDDTVISLYWLRPGVFQLFSLNRATEDGRMDIRRQRMVKLFHQEAIRLFGTSLAVDADPLAALSPRFRDVLVALASGDSEKQVAAKLVLSRHTVHDYIAALYQRFDVHSRAELIAAYWRLHTGST